MYVRCSTADAPADAPFVICPARLGFDAKGSAEHQKLTQAAGHSYGLLGEVSIGHVTSIALGHERMTGLFYAARRFPKRGCRVGTRCFDMRPGTPEVHNTRTVSEYTHQDK